MTGYTDNSIAPVFPTTGGAYDTSFNGGNDVFVTKFNAAGTALVYSTFLGGTSNDFGNAIALDSTGNAYVAGQSFAGDFPRTTLQTWSGGSDGFVTKLNTTGTALVYSGYVGGTGFDAISGIAVDTSGSAYPRREHRFDGSPGVSRRRGTRPHLQRRDPATRSRPG